MLRAFLVLPLCGILGSSHAGQSYPFIGQWDCQVATFTFDQQGYDTGSDDLPYVDAGDGNWLLDFADGYQIGLSGVTDTSMQWLSLASGDMFDCTAIK